MSADDHVKVPKFDGKNFQGWKRQVEVVLATKNLTKVLELDYFKNVDVESQKYQQLLKLDVQAQSILFTAMKPAIVEEIMSCRTAATIWERLLLIYENSSDNNVERLLSEFHTYVKPDRTSMAQHISRIDSLALQLQQVGEPQSERAIMSKMLNSLSDSYKHLKTAWDSVHPDHKTKKELVDRLIKEEIKGRPNQSSGDDDNGMVMAAAGRPRGKGGKKAGSKCYNCGKLGHWARECRSSKKTEGDDAKSGRPRDEDEPKFMMAVSNIKADQRWIMDSGASYHVCQSRDMFDSYEVIRDQLKAGGGQVRAIGKGQVTLRCVTPGGQRTVVLKDVLHIPNMGINLFSVGRVQLGGYQVKIHAKGTHICDKNEVLVSGVLNPGNAMTVIEQVDVQSRAMMIKANRSLEEWHKAFGHASAQTIERMAKDNLVEGLNIGRPNSEECEVCPLGKGTRACHTQPSSINPQAVGEHLDMDLVAEKDVTLGGRRYALICKDRYSGYTYLYLMKTRNEDETCQKLQELFAAFESESGRPIRKIRTDNGSEFIGRKVRTLCAVEHCVLDFAAARTPEQNGAAERNNRTLIEMSRVMLADNPHLPYGLWGEALCTAVYLRNRIPKTGKDKSPFEIHFGRRPRVDHLVPFGMDVQSLINDRKTAKFEAKTEPGYVVGFTNRANTYRVFLANSSKLKITCDVIFRKHLNVGRPTEQPRQAEDHAKLSLHQDDQDDNQIVEVPDDTIVEDNQDDGHQIPSEDTTNNEADVQGTSRDHQVEPVQAPSSLDDYFDWLRSKVGCDRRVTRSMTNYGMCLVADDEPKRYSDAINGANAVKWKEAINSELLAHKNNQTWSVVGRPADGTTLTAKWVFKQKRDVDGHVLRYKARLVARGYEQKEGIDYQETFAPVARCESIRILLSIAAAKNLQIERFDVSTAFLYGQIQEDVHIEPPEGVDVQPGDCLKLNKALYGLKQAPKVWNSTFDRAIRSLGFEPILSDPCIYISKALGCYLGLYVDDFITVARTSEICMSVIGRLNKSFETKHVQGGEFLGVQIIRTSTGIHLSQRKYIKEMLHQFKMNECSEAPTPLADTKMLFEVDVQPNIAVPYRSAIGSLLYAALNTRPDILFTTILLSRFNENPKRIHWLAVKRVFRYLKSTDSKGLLFKSGRPHEDLNVQAYCDADWASDQQTRKSTSGVLIFVSGCPVIFVSKQQATVAQSSTEAELIAANEAVREIAWVVTFLKELDVQHARPTVFVDNMGAIHMIKNNDVRRRSKHIDIKYHYVRLKYQEGLFDVKHIGTSDQRADFLTKSLGRPQLEKLLIESNVVDPPDAA